MQSRSSMRSASASVGSRTPSIATPSQNGSAVTPSDVRGHNPALVSNVSGISAIASGGSASPSGLVEELLDQIDPKRHEKNAFDEMERPLELLSMRPPGALGKSRTPTELERAQLIESALKAPLGIKDRPRQLSTHSAFSRSASSNQLAVALRGGQLQGASLASGVTPEDLADLKRSGLGGPLGHESVAVSQALTRPSMPRASSAPLNDAAQELHNDGLVDRVLQRRTLRLAAGTGGDTDPRFVPSHKHPVLALENQVMNNEVRFAQEANKLLDSKAAVADLVHRYRDGREVRNNIERSVEQWSHGLLSSAATEEHDNRLAEVEHEQEETSRSEKTVETANRHMQIGFKRLDIFGKELADVAEKSHGLYGFQRGRHRTVGTLTTLTFYSGLAVVAETEGDAHDAGETTLLQTQTDQVLALQQRLARRDALLTDVMKNAAAKDRFAKIRLAEEKTRTAVREQEIAQLRVYIEALQTGRGFTHLWDLAEEESDISRFIRDALKQALMAAQEELQASLNKDTETVVKDEVKKKLKKADEDLPTPSQIKERAEFKEKSREFMATIASLKKDLELKDEVINDREEAFRRVDSENQSLKIVITTLKDDSGGKNDKIVALERKLADVHREIKEQENHHLRDLDEVKAAADRAIAELTNKLTEARRELDKAERGAENKAAIHSAHIVHRNAELEDAIKNLKDLNRILDTRCQQLSTQVQELVTNSSAFAGNVLMSTVAMRNQVNAFKAESEMDPLRQCVWRGTTEALQDVEHLLTSMGVYHNQNASLPVTLKGATTALKTEFISTIDDMQRLALKKEVDKLSSQNAEIMVRLKALADETELLKEKRKRTLETIKAGVTQLMARASNQAALRASSSGTVSTPKSISLGLAFGGDGGVEAEISALFSDGITALDEADSRREELLQREIKRGALAQHQVISLADENALPMFDMLTVLTSMCHLLRATSEYMYKAIAVPITDWMPFAEGIGEDTKSTLRNMLREVGVEIPKRNIGLIVSNLKVRLFSKIRLSHYRQKLERVIALAEQDPNATEASIAGAAARVRRQMNHVERSMFQQHRQIFNQFIALHQRRAVALLKMDAFVKTYKQATGLQALPGDRNSPSPLRDQVDEATAQRLIRRASASLSEVDGGGFGSFGGTTPRRGGGGSGGPNSQSESLTGSTSMSPFATLSSTSHLLTRDKDGRRGSGLGHTPLSAHRLSVSGTNMGVLSARELELALPNAFGVERRASRRASMVSIVDSETSFAGGGGGPLNRTGTNTRNNSFDGNVVSMSVDPSWVAFDEGDGEGAGITSMTTSFAIPEGVVPVTPSAPEGLAPPATTPNGSTASNLVSPKVSPSSKGKESGKQPRPGSGGGRVSPSLGPSGRRSPASGGSATASALAVKASPHDVPEPTAARNVLSSGSSGSSLGAPQSPEAAAAANLTRRGSGDKLQGLPVSPPLATVAASLSPSQTPSPVQLQTVERIAGSVFSQVSKMLETLFRGVLAGLTPSQTKPNTTSSHTESSAASSFSFGKGLSEHDVKKLIHQVRSSLLLVPKQAVADLQGGASPSPGMLILPTPSDVSPAAGATQAGSPAALLPQPQSATGLSLTDTQATKLQQLLSNWQRQLQEIVQNGVATLNAKGELRLKREVAHAVAAEQAKMQEQIKLLQQGHETKSSSSSASSPKPGAASSSGSPSNTKISPRMKALRLDESSTSLFGGSETLADLNDPLQHIQWLKQELADAKSQLRDARLESAKLAAALQDIQLAHQESFHHPRRHTAVAGDHFAMSGKKKSDIITTDPTVLGFIRQHAPPPPASRGGVPGLHFLNSLEDEEGGGGSKASGGLSILGLTSGNRAASDSPDRKGPGRSHGGLTTVLSDVDLLHSENGSPTAQGTANRDAEKKTLFNNWEESQKEQLRMMKVRGGGDSRAKADREHASTETPTHLDARRAQAQANRLRRKSQEALDWSAEWGGEGSGTPAGKKSKLPPPSALTLKEARGVDGEGGTAVEYADMSCQTDPELLTEFIFTLLGLSRESLYATHPIPGLGASSPSKATLSGAKPMPVPTTLPPSVAITGQWTDLRNSIERFLQDGRKFTDMRARMATSGGTGVSSSNNPAGRPGSASRAPLGEENLTGGPSGVKKVTLHKRTTLHGAAPAARMGGAGFGVGFGIRPHTASTSLPKVNYPLVVTDPYPDVADPIVDTALVLYSPRRHRSDRNPDVGAEVSQFFEKRRRKRILQRQQLHDDAEQSPGVEPLEFDSTGQLLDPHRGASSSGEDKDDDESLAEDLLHLHLGAHHPAVVETIPLTTHATRAEIRKRAASATLYRPANDLDLARSNAAVEITLLAEPTKARAASPSSLPNRLPPAPLVRNMIQQRLKNPPKPAQVHSKEKAVSKVAGTKSMQVAVAVQSTRTQLTVPTHSGGDASGTANLSLNHDASFRLHRRPATQEPAVGTKNEKERTTGDGGIGFSPSQKKSEGQREKPRSQSSGLMSKQAGDGTASLGPVIGEFNGTQREKRVTLVEDSAGDTPEISAPDPN